MRNLISNEPSAKALEPITSALEPVVEPLSETTGSSGAFARRKTEELSPSGTHSPQIARHRSFSTLPAFGESFQPPGISRGHMPSSMRTSSAALHAGSTLSRARRRGSERASL